MHIKYSGVYQIVNEVNGKSYVGSSVDINGRWRKWRSYARKNTLRYPSMLVKAFQKYGIEHFTFILLEECEPTKEALENLEQHYIDLLKPEYNILPKAYSAIGNKSRKGQKQTDEEKENHRKAAIAMMSDPEVRAKISRAMTGVKKNYVTATTGTHRSEETKQKIIESHKLSEKTKAYAEKRKGKPNMATSRSGEFGIRWRGESQKWTVKIDNRNYGAFEHLTDAIERRDYIISLDLDSARSE